MVLQVPSTVKYSSLSVRVGIKKINLLVFEDYFWQRNQYMHTHANMFLKKSSLTFISIYLNMFISLCIYWNTLYKPINFEDKLIKYIDVYQSRKKHVKFYFRWKLA